MKNDLSRKNTLMPTDLTELSPATGIGKGKTLPPELLNASPVRANRRFLWLGLSLMTTLMLGILGMVAWMYYGTIEESVEGVGQLVPQGKVRHVMAPEKAEVTKVFVKENDFVKAGQVLMTLNPENVVIQQDTFAKQLSSLQNDISSLRSGYRDGSITGSGSAAAWVEASREAKEANLAEARMMIEEAQQELAKAEEEMIHLQSLLSSQEEQYKQYQSLHAAGGFSVKDLRAYEQEVIQRRGQIAAQEKLIAAKKAALARAQQEPASIEATFRSEVLNKINTLEKQTVDLSGNYSIARANLKHYQVKAPVSGVINETVVRGPGEVVTPGQGLLSIVPQNTGLVAEVRVMNKDLSYIHLGQKAKLRLDAFPYYQFGTLDGTVVAISPSTVSDPEGRPFYLVQIKPDRQFMAKNGKRFAMRSGMTVAADIITREKNILSFFTEPIHLKMDRAFRNPTNR